MASGSAQVRALLELQWRTLRNAFRDRAERRGTIFSILLSVVWYGFWLSVAAVCAVTPRLIGVEELRASLGGVLLFALAYWQLSPVLTLSLGVSLEMRKLALYPVSVGTLFFVECLLRLWTGFEIVLVLTGLFVGLAAEGSFSATPLLGAWASFVAFNMFFSAGVRNLIERVFRNRALREIVLIGMVTLTVVPQTLVFSERARGWASQIAENEFALPYWTTPAGLAARWALGDASSADVALLGAMIAAAAVFGFFTFRSSCRLTGGSTADQQAPRVGERLSAPWRAVLARVAPDPLAALVEKEIRYLWRSPRFRLPFFMGFTFGVIAWAPIALRLEGSLGEWFQSGAPSFISLYALLLLGPVMFLNRFGFDRGATRFYFWMPVSFEELLAAKNAATCFFAAVEVAAIMVMCWAVGLPVGLRQMLEAPVVAVVALLYLLSVGNHMSVSYPTASNPDRVSRAAPGQGVRAAAQFFLFPLSLAPVIAAFLVRYARGGATPFLLTLAIAALGGAALYWRTFGRVAEQGRRGRERFLGILAQGESAIAAE